MSKLRCALFATPDIATDCLTFLAQFNEVELALVVSMPDRPAGRGKELRSPAIADLAKKLNIKCIQTENVNRSEEYKEWIRDNNLDFIIVFAFAQFLGEEILSTPRLGCFNIHTSLLPKYRGAAPMQYALFNGDKKTGITIQRMVKKMDAGNIVLSKEVEIFPEDNFGSLHDKFKTMAPELIKIFIGNLIKGDLNEQIQDESKASFAPTISKTETLIDFNTKSNIEIHNLIRGLSPIPGAYCFINNKRLKVFSSELSSIELKPSETSVDFNTLLVGTKNGSIRLSKVQVEGKSIGTDLELINGFKNSKKEIHISSKKENE